MTNHTNRSRQPKGVPVGGQFATETKSESSSSLDSAEGIFYCQGCGREELDCSLDPCDDVLEDRGEITADERRFNAALEAGDVTPAQQANWEASRGSQRADHELGGLAMGDISHVGVGFRTPWGRADRVKHPADGIVAVSTPGHGGIKLSPERNAMIPASLRTRSGWYEEDCEAAIVGLFHPEAYPRMVNAAGNDCSVVREQFRDSVKNWFPDGYEKAMGVEIPLEESYTKRRAAEVADAESFRAAHADEFLSTGWSNANDKWIPDGYRVITAVRDADGEERHYLMPDADCIKDNQYQRNVVVQPGRHLDVTEIYAATTAPPTEPPVSHELGVSYDHLTEAQKMRAEKELTQMFRWPDGSVASLADRMADRGVCGKSFYVDGNGRTSYSVNYEGSYVQPLSKAAYDALAGVPENMSDLDLARVEVSKARHRLEKTSRFDRAKYEKAGAALEAARAKLAGAEAEDHLKNPLNHYESIQALRAEAWKRLCERDGINI